MASVDGKRATDKTTDTLHKFRCDPCARSGLVKDASTYCKQCEEYMCVTCASVHSGLKVARNHAMVFGSDLALTGQSGTRKVSLSYCAKHGDKEIEWFCEKHGAMFCYTCKITKHRKCKVMLLSDKSTSKYVQSLADVIGSLVSLKRRLEILKIAREKSAADLVNFKKSCESAVQQFKSTIIEKLDRLEEEILADINKVVTTETAVIQDHVNTCDHLVPQVEVELTTADEAKEADDDVSSMIAAHKLSKLLTTLEPTVSDLEQEVHDLHITFQPSLQLTDIISEIDQLGVLETNRTETVGVNPPASTSHSTCPEFDSKSWLVMKVESSKEISDFPSDNVTGSAVMPDGRLIFCTNIEFILLDQEFAVLWQMALADRHHMYDVAVYGDNAAVVTMPYKRQLQYIQVNPTLKIGHIFPTRLQCLGVAVHGGEIYVGVRGGQYGRHVQVMDTRGNVTRRIGEDTHGTRGQPLYQGYVTVGTSGTVYISDNSCGRILCYTSAGDVVYNVNHEGMSGPCGISVDEEDNLLVCCPSSNTIHVLRKDGAHHRVILSSADGVEHPQSVSYRRSDQTLIVTMKNRHRCRAYKLTKSVSTSVIH